MIIEKNAWENFKTAVKRPVRFRRMGRGGRRSSTTIKTTVTATTIKTLTQPNTIKDRVFAKETNYPDYLFKRIQLPILSSPDWRGIEQWRELQVPKYAFIQGWRRRIDGVRQLFNEDHRDLSENTITMAGIYKSKEPNPSRLGRAMCSQPYRGGLLDQTKGRASVTRTSTTRTSTTSQYESSDTVTDSYRQRVLPWYDGIHRHPAPTTSLQNISELDYESRRNVLKQWMKRFIMVLSSSPPSIPVQQNVTNTFTSTSTSY